MKILQWSMTIPKKKQKGFVQWFNKVAGPALGGFGAKKHELYKVNDQQIIGKQLVEKDRFIERVYFDNEFNIPDYFKAVKRDPKTWRVSREYEEKFNAVNIELRVLSLSSIN